jgi:hypothetical protein
LRSSAIQQSNISQKSSPHRSRMAGELFDILVQAFLALGRAVVQGHLAADEAESPSP